MSGSINLTLKIWRQKSANTPGQFITYEAREFSKDMSFLEMLDVINDEFSEKGEEPFAFDSDCREGICGMCGVVINGIPHGREKNTTACQLHLRHFTNGETLWIEPFRARAFPVVKDLVVDRSAFDRVVQKGGYISVNTGNAPDANSLPVPHDNAEKAFDAAACIGCGACVASCRNASAMLFVSAKISHLGQLPQGQPESDSRVLNMVKAMDEEGFGNCTNQLECEAACPKGVKVENIAFMNRQFLKASIAAG